MNKRLLDPIGSPPVQGPQHLRKGLVLCLIVLLMALAGCKPKPAPQPDSVVKQLEYAVNEAYLSDTDRLEIGTGMFAKDAVVGIGSDISFSGEQEIQQWLKSLFMAADNLKLERQNMKVNSEQVTASYAVSLNSISGVCVQALTGTAEVTIALNESGEIQAGKSKITALHFSLDKASQAKLDKARLLQSVSASPKLAYAVIPDPSPLRVDEGAGNDRASFTVMVTNQTDQPVMVTDIRFRLPEGFHAAQLAGNPTKISVNSPVGEWSITEDEGGTFVLAPMRTDEGQLNAGDSLHFAFEDLLVPNPPGSSNVEITERVRTGNEEPTMCRTVVQLDKLPSRFYVSDLNAKPLIVEAGSKTTLTWSGSANAIHTITYWNGIQEVSEPVPGPPYIYETEPLLETTTFYLDVEARRLNETVKVHRERTVTVFQPTPVPIPVPTESSDEGKPDYLDDRSSPEALIASYFNAIQRQEYARAYSYWRDPVDTFDKFVERWQSLQPGDPKIERISSEQAMHTVTYTVSALFTTHTTDGSEQRYTDCFVIRQPVVNIQAGPLYKPLTVRSGNPRKVDSNANPDDLLKGACNESGVAPSNLAAEEKLTSGQQFITSLDTFQDNRSRPLDVLGSFFSAINRQEYGRAYSYWEGAGSFLQPAPFEQFQQSYTGFRPVQMTTTGDMRSWTVNGNTYYSVPAFLEVLISPEMPRRFAACYTLHWLNPDLQNAPPYQPLAIQSALVLQVAGDANPEDLLSRICSEP